MARVLDWLNHGWKLLLAVAAAAALLAARFEDIMRFFERMRAVPRLYLEILRTQVWADVARQERKPFGKHPRSSVFDCDVFVYLYVVNRGREATVVRDWKLAVTLTKKKATVPNIPIFEGERFLLDSAGPNKRRLAEEVKDTQLQQRQPYEGWLHFRVEGILSRELATESKFQVIAVDVDNRRHSSKVVAVRQIVNS